MPHSVDVITTIAAALGLALIFGFIAVRLRPPALVGYLLASILIGPFTPGFVPDTALAGQLAEIGVMLLMFGVGLHFSRDAPGSAIFFTDNRSGLPYVVAEQQREPVEKLPGRGIHAVVGDAFEPAVRPCHRRWPA